MSPTQIDPLRPGVSASTSTASPSYVVWPTVRPVLGSSTYTTGPSPESLIVRTRDPGPRPTSTTALDSSISGSWTVIRSESVGVTARTADRARAITAAAPRGPGARATGRA